MGFQTAPKLTNVGKVQYYNNLAGDALTFTRIKIGNGNLPSGQAIAELTDLVSTVAVMDAYARALTTSADISGSFSNAFTETFTGDGSATAFTISGSPIGILRVMVAGSAVTGYTFSGGVLTLATAPASGAAIVVSYSIAAFYFREIGVFVADPDHPDDRSHDILYCYANAYSYADYIPSATSQLIEKYITVPVVIGDSAEVYCIVDPSLIYSPVNHTHGNITNDGKVGTAAGKLLATSTGGAVEAKTLEELGVQAATHGQTTEAALADADEFTFYDASVNENRKTLWSNIKAKLKAFFESLDPLPIANGGTAGSTAAGGLYNLQHPLTAVTTLAADDYICAEITTGETVKKISILDLKEVLGVASPTIAVETYSGASVTCTDGTTTMSGVGSCSFSLPNMGTWTVSASYDGKTASTSISVTGPILYTAELPILASLSVEDYLDTFEYGDALTFGGTATAAYYGGATEDVTPTLSPAAGSTLTTIGSNTITASYTENGVTVSTTYTVTVAKKSLAIPSQSGTLTYTGSSRTPNWNNYDSGKMTIGGTTSATNAGSYTATFTLSDTAHYQWSDGTTAPKSVTWAIAAASISGAVITLGSSLTYNGSNQTQTVSGVVMGGVTLTPGTDYILSGNTGTNAGSYLLTVTGTGNYTGTATKSWSIAKAAGSASVDPASLSIAGGAGTTKSSAVTRSGDGTITAVSSNTGVATAAINGTSVVVTSVATGTATITVNVAESANYLAASCTLPVSVTIVDAVLNNNTWDQIRAMSDAGMAASFWAVGDAKAVTLNGSVGNYTFSSYSTYVFIIGFDHNSAYEGSNRIHFQFGKTALTGGTDISFADSQYSNAVTATGYFSINSSRTNVGGWKSSQMRANICGTSLSSYSGKLIGALPSALRAVLKSVAKYTDNTGGNSGSVLENVTATTDYVFLLAEYEVRGVRNSANSYEQNYQAQYAYYSAGNSKVKYKHTALTTAVNWYLRSPVYNDATRFIEVSSSGSVALIFADFSYGFAPAFCV